ncbi:MAG TPA: thioredoxin family protein, partial [Burkholderiaceae bacterium]
EGVAAGQPLWVGLRITHQPEWHTYWKNAGDSGLPTELAWTLPPGVEAGAPAWPLPQKIRIGNLVNYGYEGTVLLPVPLTVSPQYKPPLFNAQGGTLKVKLQASWLVCRKECIPEQGSFTLQVPVHGATALDNADFTSALAAQPRPLPGTQSPITLDGQRLLLRVSGLPAATRGQALEVFPETPEVIDNDAAARTDGWQQQWDGSTWTASLPLSPQRSASPATLPLVLALRDAATGQAQGWRAEWAVAGTWPAMAAPATVSPALRDALAANANATGNAPPPPPNPLPATALGAVLAAALLGGLVLNLMPCVLPVLAIKALGLARHAGQPAQRRAAGLAYTVGVVLSFLALGGLMLALRAAGEAVGWGFQLQSPAFVAALAALFTLIGLNLAGLFEFGSLLPSRMAALQTHHPVADALLSGVLAVALASPCTAPFMGASLGLAVGLPAAQALLVFGAIGLGLALPFLLVALLPASARWLPRPGAWMAVFRKAMAFPMFATVAWLTWVLGQQSGIDGAGALLALLVALAAVVWSLTLAGRTRIVVAIISIATFALLAGAMGKNMVHPAPVETAAQADAGWQPWSAALVAQRQAAGQPVFVDFTAAWCVTCQYNKQTTLSNAEVLADLRQRNVALLRADWTRRDPAITAALRNLGRSGVPVYVLYAPGRAPEVLSEVLGAGELRAALGRL